LLLPNLLLPLTIDLLLLLLTLLVALTDILYTSRVFTLTPLILLANLIRTGLAPVVRPLPLLSLNLPLLFSCGTLLLPLLFRSCTLLLSLLFRRRTLLLALLFSRLLLSRPICSLLILPGTAIVLLLDLLLLVFFFVTAVPASLGHRPRNHQRAHRYYSKPPFYIPFHLETPFRNARAKSLVHSSMKQGTCHGFNLCEYSVYQTRG
jgi:hypothetical protein